VEVQRIVLSNISREGRVQVPERERWTARFKQAARELETATISSRF
jgi:hypothetical protein